MRFTPTPLGEQPGSTYPTKSKSKVLNSKKISILKDSFKAEHIEDDSSEEERQILASLSWRDFVFKMLTETTFNRVSFCYTVVNVLAILASTVTFLMSSVTDFRAADADPHSPLNAIEIAAVAIFTFDYIARFVLTRQNKITFALGLMNTIDLLAIIPSYVELFMDGSGSGIGALVVVRILRLFRVFRLAKMMKYSKQLPILLKAIEKSAGGFAMGMFSIAMFLILWASAIFYSETSYCQFDPSDGLWKYDDGSVTDFQSIPHSLWWTTVTMTTVGYGDDFPRTEAGKAVASMVMVSGVMVLAFPLTVLAGNFMQEWTNFLAQEEKNTLLRWKQDFSKLLRRIHSIKSDKDLKGALPPLPPTLVKRIWDEMLTLRNNIDICNTALSSVEVQIEKVNILIKQLEVSVKLTEVDRKFKLS